MHFENISSVVHCICSWVSICGISNQHEMNRLFPTKYTMLVTGQCVVLLDKVKFIFLPEDRGGLRIINVRSATGRRFVE